MIHERVKNNTALLAKIDLYLTAAFSMTDMISDVYMVARYTGTGHRTYAAATIICIR